MNEQAVSCSSHHYSQTGSTGYEYKLDPIGPNQNTSLHSTSHSNMWKQNSKQNQSQHENQFIGKSFELWQPNKTFDMLTRVS